MKGKIKKLIFNIFIIAILVFSTTIAIVDAKYLTKNYKPVADNTTKLNTNNYPWTYEYLEGSDEAEWHTGYFPNIDLDSNGYPHIVYCDFGTGSKHYPIDFIGDVKYSYWNGNRWVVETVDSEQVSGMEISFSLDDYDRPHIVYIRDTHNGVTWNDQQSLCYATRYNGDWEIDIIDDCWSGDWTRIEWECDLALDSYGNPHVSYSAKRGVLLDTEIIYAKNTGYYWEKEVIAEEDGTSYGKFFTSIAVDHYGDAHIIFDGETGEGEDKTRTLNYISNSAGLWGNIEVLLDEYAGWHGAIATDYYGTPHVVSEIKKNYSYDFEKHMVYLTKTGGFWDMEIFDSDFEYKTLYQESDIVIDSYESPHIVYNYVDTQEPYYTWVLRYATKLGGYWEVENVIPINEINLYGNDPKIVLDYDNNPYVSARSDDLNCLMYFAKIAGPERPEAPNGEYDGEAGVSYTYTTVADSYLEGDIQYGWDWDGDFIIDEWTPWYEPGDVIASTHSWEISGYYEVRVKARSKNTGQSEWSDPLSVSIPRSRSVVKPGIYLLEYLRFILEKMDFS